MDRDFDMDAYRPDHPYNCPHALQLAAVCDGEQLKGSARIECISARRQEVYVLTVLPWHFMFVSKRALQLLKLICLY
jgi:hypothetical protein